MHELDKAKKRKDQIKVLYLLNVIKSHHYSKFFDVQIQSAEKNWEGNTGKATFAERCK